MELLKHTSVKNIDSVPIGVVYITNPEFSNITNFNFNQYYVRIIDIILEQLSISNFYIVPIGLNLSTTPSPAQTAYINAQFNKYPAIKHFFCSFPDNYLLVIFEAYFKYNHEKIVLSTGSVQTQVNFQDNVFRFAQNDYPLINFISNLYFKESLAFDLIYIPGEFFTGRGAGTTDFQGFNEIITDTTIINEYLITSNRFMIENPFVLTQQPPGLSRSQFVAQMKSVLSNPNYYAPGNNYFQTNIQQYTINYDVITNPEFVAKYGLDAMDVLAWKINNLWIDAQTQIPNIQRMSYIEILCIYLVFFDYTQNKDMVFIITNYNFPVFISAVNYYLPIFANLYDKPDVFNQFTNKVRFVLTGVNNRNEYTYELFTDPQTNTLWYNSGKTWYETISAFETRICVQRIDQSMFVLIEKMSRDLNLRSRGKYIDISTTPQPAIIAAYNAVEFLFHFVQNEIDLGPFILSYFNNATLLQYGDNLVFNSNMDNVYGVNLLTFFFNEGSGSIINRNIVKDINTAVTTGCGNWTKVNSKTYTGKIKDAVDSTAASINGYTLQYLGYNPGIKCGCIPLIGQNPPDGFFGQSVNVKLQQYGDVCFMIDANSANTFRTNILKCPTNNYTAP
jgi:hypothetical protein